MKYLALPLLALLSACGTSFAVLENRPVPVFPEPEPIIQQDYNWIVITRDNVDEVLAALEASGQQVVLFAVSPEGHNAISMNAAELRRYIRQQDSIIEAYRIYLEPED